MNTYSHEAFNVTGIVKHFNYQNLDVEMPDFWDKLRTTDMIQGIITTSPYKGLHAVYYNHDKEGFEMLVGYITIDTDTQTDSKYTTITIPEQDYMYETIKFDGPESISNLWQKINSIPKTEVPRKFGFDLEMYTEDMLGCTVAVSVI